MPSYRYIKQVLNENGSLVDVSSFVDCDNIKKARTLLFNLASHGFLPSDCVSVRMSVSNKNPDDFIWVRDPSFLPPPVEPKVVVSRKKKTAQSGK